jgi:hypothetical protein
MCVHVCACVCMCVHVCACVCMCVHACPCVCLCVAYRVPQLETAKVALDRGASATLSDVLGRTSLDWTLGLFLAAQASSTSVAVADVGTERLRALVRLLNAYGVKDSASSPVSATDLASFDVAPLLSVPAVRGGAGARFDPAAPVGKAGCAASTPCTERRAISALTHPHIVCATRACMCVCVCVFVQLVATPPPTTGCATRLSCMHPVPSRIHCL